MPVTRDAQAPVHARAQLTAALARVALGEKAALKVVYELTSFKLFGVCIRILKEREDAEDALQDIYVSVWSRAAGFDSSRASPITWLATIARNRCIDRLRSRRGGELTSIEEAEGIPDETPDAFANASDAQDQVRLNDCLERLEPQHRRAIRSAFFDGFAYSQLATRDGVPLGTMKSWIRRALQQLKGCLSA